MGSAVGGVETEDLTAGVPGVQGPDPQQVTFLDQCRRGDSLGLLALVALAVRRRDRDVDVELDEEFHASTPLTRRRAAEGSRAARGDHRHCARPEGSSRPAPPRCAISVHERLHGTVRRVLDSDPRAGLVGRRSDCDVLDRVLDDVRAHQSRVLVLRGEPGIGKTALMEHLAGTASGCRVVRAAGVQSEGELAFAGAQQLCAPILDKMDALPGPQRDALGTAFGLVGGLPADRFLVGLAVLTLMSAAAEEQPLVCLIDDAQWLDQVSGQMLAFVARRLLAESIALVFAVRESGAPPELADLPEHTVGGLADTDARALLDAVYPGRLDERVRDRIVAESRGNPLALLELPRGSTAGELAGGFAVPGTGPLAGQIEYGFLTRVRSLPEETQRLLLIAAAEPLGDGILLQRAADLLDIGTDARSPAEEEGLIEFGARVRFRHPLVRSAAYRAGSVSDRQAVHQALAEVTDPQVEPDRRAWHRAHAAAALDEEVAVDLEGSAERARSRGGAAA